LELKPDSPQIRSAWQRVRAELRKKAKAEKKTYGGIFERAPLSSSDAGGDVDAKVLPAARENADLEKKIDDASKLREYLLKDGRVDEAQEAEAAIRVCKERIAERRSRTVDVFNPTPELIDEAREFGIDLRKKGQQEELDQMYWQVHQSYGAAMSPNDKSGFWAELTLTRLLRAMAPVLVLVLVLARMYWGEHTA